MAASTEIALSRLTYDVFLSFRGKDTRFHFTDHLNTALKQAGFHTFRDDEELRRGEDIETELQKAIQESKISVIVFSKDYASSAWCLDELVQIMKKMSGGGHTVLPIFYHVPPTDVRNQTGSFASSFIKHKEKFTTQTDKINQWRDALIDATKLAGMELKDKSFLLNFMLIRPGQAYESHFIQDVVREIRNKLHRKYDIELNGLRREVWCRVEEEEVWFRVEEEEEWEEEEEFYSFGDVYNLLGYD